jgi:hypothetical protein
MSFGAAFCTQGACMQARVRVHLRVHDCKLNPLMENTVCDSELPLLAKKHPGLGNSMIIHTYWWMSKCMGECHQVGCDAFADCRSNPMFLHQRNQWLRRIVQDPSHSFLATSLIGSDEYCLSLCELPAGCTSAMWHPSGIGRWLRSFSSHVYLLMAHRKK